MVFKEQTKTFCPVLPRVLHEIEEVDVVDLDPVAGGVTVCTEMVNFFKAY